MGEQMLGEAHGLARGSLEAGRTRPEDSQGQRERGQEEPAMADILERAPRMIHQQPQDKLPPAAGSLSYAGAGQAGSSPALPTSTAGSSWGRRRPTPRVRARTQGSGS